MKKGLKFDFTLIAILLIPIGVAINVVISQLVQVLRIPLYLDAIGTMLVAMIAGPWVGLVTGGLTNVIKSIFSPTELPFAIVSMVIGLTVGYFSIKKMFTSVGKTIIAGVILTFIVIIVSTPISVILFGGSTGDSSSAVRAIFLASGQGIWKSVFSSNLLIESIDKILSLLITYTIVKKMSDRYLSKHNYGQNFLDS
ncbi:ECF transporter S component [Neobacillus soli]|uniref:ECF transporter S component n=1 Tax=Neobacillus soli TaxID=220688 RepID=UPI0008248B26|nr:ECF transporter S component [Neobacillus soli]